MTAFQKKKLNICKSIKKTIWKISRTLNHKYHQIVERAQENKLVRVKWLNLVGAAELKNQKIKEVGCWVRLKAVWEVKWKLFLMMEAILRMQVGHVAEVRHDKMWTRVEMIITSHLHLMLYDTKGSLVIPLVVASVSACTVKLNKVNKAKRQW